jgi:hypothetical protein
LGAVPLLTERATGKRRMVLCSRAAARVVFACAFPRAPQAADLHSDFILHWSLDIGHWSFEFAIRHSEFVIIHERKAAARKGRRRTV